MREVKLNRGGGEVPKRVTALHGLIAFAAFAAMSSSALAGGAPPPLVPTWKQSHLKEGDPAVRSLYIYAVCARNHRREAAEALLRTRPDSAEERALIPTVFPSGLTDCPIATTKLTIRSMALVRGAVAEALYNGDDIKPRGDSPLPLAESFKRDAGNSALAVGRWVARCSVRHNPRLAHRLVHERPGSVGETNALKALRPVFTACLPAGERLQVSRVAIRALVAEHLYEASMLFKESFANAKG
jgi:hypothetical protein